MPSVMGIGQDPLIKDYIKGYPNEQVNYDLCFLKNVITSQNGLLIINDRDILDKYRTELDEHKVRMDLNNQDQIKYRYNPKLLSFDLYGTTELWFLLLYANELYSVNEFDLTRPFIYDTSIYQTLIRALDLEKDFTDLNQSEVSEMLKGNAEVI